MKRLVDESTDELTRSLLVAGIEHRPPPGNRARVMMALGAGGALGLFSSNAFAWLGTTAGKVTAASVVVGIAGAALVVVPQVRGGDAGQARNDGPDRSHEVARLRSPAESSAAAGSIASTGSPERAAREPSAPRVDAEVDGITPAPSAAFAADGEPLAHEAQLTEARRPAARREPAQRAAKGRARKSAARKKEASRRDEGAQTAAPLASVSAGAGGADTEVSAPGGLAAQSDLDAEVRLVDDMHQAVRRQDDEALGRFIERYRLMFPNGQLKKEVAEFAERRSAADSRSATDGPDTDRSDSEQ